MTGRIRETAEKHRPALYAAALSGVLFLLLLLVSGIAPFDDRTFLFDSMERQYLSFFAEFRELFLGSESPLYSFRKGPGGEMVLFIADYLADPMLLPFLLIPVQFLPAVVSFLLFFKVIFAAFTCGLFLETVLPPGKENRAEMLSLVLCAASFSFSAYFMANLTNIAVLNVVILLPLLCLAARHVMQGGTMFPHTLLVAFVLISNYGTAYRTLAFEALAVLVFIRPSRIRELVRYGISLLWGAALAAFLLVPAFLSMQAAAGNSRTIGFWPNVEMSSVPELLSHLYSGSFDQTLITAGAPHLYIGTLLLFPAILFFVTGGVRFADKLRTLVLLCILSVFILNDAFLMAFLLVILALRGLYALLRAEATPGQVLMALILLLAGTIYVFSHFFSHLSRNDKFYNLFLIAAGVILCFLLLGARQKRPRMAKTVLLVLAAVQLLDLLVNAREIYEQSSVFQTPYSSFLARYADLKQAVSSLPAGDILYRTESLPPYEQNNAMLLGYNGITRYGSGSSLREREFLREIGFNDNGSYAEYSPDNTGSADALLGIRYILNGREAEEIGSYLPMALVCDTDPVIADSGNPFACSEALLSAMAGERVRLFAEAGFSCETGHPTRDGDIPYHFTITPEADGELFFYLKDCSGDSNLLLDRGTEEFLPYGNLAALRVVSLGEQSAGVPAEFTVHAYDGELVGTPLFYTEDADALAAVTAKIRQRAGGIACVNSADLIAAVPAAAESALFMIPYDEAWYITADRRQVTVVPWADYYTRVILDGDGEDEGGARDETIYLRMQYAPRGLAAGIFISLTALAVLCAMERKRRR
ncbi:MAG: YfhO family protein [Lachnospiraceae bacterium]|nr:YfhO family protein [Lachnospiraceae bacterium]